MDDDTDSLFGSPPPSPARGRSSSPTLALPTRQSQGSSTQNVGTIALPGSQHHSELPVTPLALSLSHPANTPAAQTPRPTPGSATSTTPSSSRSTSLAPAISTKKKRSRRKSTSAQSTPRTEIVLPDPSEPLPAHFLRNSSALLGTAGLVAGVRPSNLPNRHTRGTTPSNPIVVEDEECIPAPAKPMQCSHQNLGGIDPRLLPTPSTQDIVAMLVGQRDIFPVLEGILRLIAGSHNYVYFEPAKFFRAPPAFLRKRQEYYPPVKRRKLNRVPAGAVDWDVPYPFKEGEGPEAYRSTWEQERGRNLLFQLMNLIQDATRKAAAKNYLQTLQTEDRGRHTVQGQHVAIALGVDAALSLQNSASMPPVHQVPVLPRTSTLVAHQTPPAAHAPIPSLAQASASFPLGPCPSQNVEHPQTPFDRLITSLLSATPQHVSLPSAGNTSGGGGIPGFPDAPQTCVPTFQSTLFDSESFDPALSNSSDQAVFDDWMNILQAFPLPAEGLTESSVQPSILPEDLGNLFDFQDWNFDPSAPILNFEPVESQSQASIDHLIDPALLLPTPPNPQSSRPLLPPSLTASPMPSAASSSFGEVGPLTPNSAGWDLDSFGPLPRAVEDMDVIEEENDQLLNKLVLEQDKQLGNVQVSDMPAEGSADIDGPESLPLSRWKGKAREVPLIPVSSSGDEHIAATLPSVLPSTSSDIGRDRMTSASVGPSRESVQAGDQAKRGSSGNSKEALLKLARERRKWLSEELIKARTQLWETTIEQGVLAEFVKRLP